MATDLRRPAQLAKLDTVPDVRVFEALAIRTAADSWSLCWRPRHHDDLDPMNLFSGCNTDGLEVTRSGTTHTRLSELADTRFVEWDRETGGFSKGPLWEEIAPLLRLIRTTTTSYPTAGCRPRATWTRLPEE